MPALEPLGGLRPRRWLHLIWLPFLACSAGGPSRESAPREGTPSPDSLQVAVVQYEIRGNASMAEIMQRVDRYGRQALAQGAELLVFPELFSLDAWPSQSEETESQIVRRLAGSSSPSLLERLREWVDRQGSYLLAGSMPWLEGDGLTNRAYLLGPSGFSHHQDKVYLTEWGRKVGMTPGRRIQVIDAPWGTTAILICYDVEFPELSQSLAASNPELWLVPSMTESPEGLQRVRWSARTRAVEHHAFVVVASTVGRPSPDWLHFGASSVVAPQGGAYQGVLAEAPEGRSTVLNANLDFQRLRRSRQQARFYPVRDQLRRQAPAPPPR